jgi:exonuclease III
MLNPKLSLLLLALLLSTSCSGPDSEPLRVMTWNIWHGGLHGDKSLDFKQDSSNTANVLKVLMQESPDILFMQETYCCGMDIAKEAGYPYSWRGSSNLSFHSKYPIIDTIHIFRAFNSHAVVIDVDGEKILCVNVWLHYLPDFFQDIKTMSSDSLKLGEGTTRLKEIKSILHSVDSLDKILNLPIIMGGDFNSGSHLDWVESTREYHYGKVVEWPVSKMMKERGFTDSFREAHPDPTLTLDGTWGFLSDDIISDRIDFIYYKGTNIKVTNSKIVQDDPPGGFFNSDHRAILSIFNLKNQDK